MHVFVRVLLLPAVLLIVSGPLFFAPAFAQGNQGANVLGSAIIFLVSLAISTVIIYVVTRIFGEKEGIGRALLTAIVGAVVYSIAYFLFGTGWLAAILGGIVWLIALRWLYDIGWLKALGIAVIVWIAAAIVGFLLPTAPGPL
jgi:hypothetical protein